MEETQNATEWVQELFINTAVNVTAFARLCGVSQPAARSWILGIQCPSRESIIQVGKALGVTPPEQVLLGAGKRKAHVSEPFIREVERGENPQKAKGERKKKNFPYCLLGIHGKKRLQEAAL